MAAHIVNAMADLDLYKLLNRKHPVYELWAPWWEKFRDVAGEEEAKKETYLPKNKLEPDKEYSFRVEMSEFIPETPRSILRVTGALYKEKPKRELKSKPLEDFTADVDLEGTDINGFMENRAITQLLTYGTTRILVNVRTPPEAIDPQTGRVVALSRAQEITLGLRPYLIPYSPLSVIDWDTDELNRLNMVRIMEITERKQDPGDALSDRLKITKFIHYDRQKSVSWEFAGDKEGQQELISVTTREHDLGVVPMVVAYWPTKLKPMVGSCYIRYMAKADLQKFRAESDQAYDTYLHAHPLFKIHTQDELAEVGIGSSTYLKLRPGTAGQEREDASYVTAPNSAFEALRQVIKDKLETIQRHANTDPLGVVEPGSKIFQASGVARAWSFGTSEARVLSELADTAAQIEKRLFDVVLRYMTPGELKEESLFEGEVQYPEEFDLSSTHTLLEETKEIAQMVNSETLLRILHKRIAASKIGDASPQMLKKVQKEIDDNPLINTPIGKEQEIIEFPLMEGGQQPESRRNEQGQRGGSFKTPDGQFPGKGKVG
jgi:hypothetical protein